jgi:hypothetical protein
MDYIAGGMWSSAKVSIMKAQHVACTGRDNRPAKGRKPRCHERRCGEMEEQEGFGMVCVCYRWVLN